MTQLNSYLTFGGNCREAMTYYKKCLGGELELQILGESQMADRIPKAMKDYILHSKLTTAGFVLMGSDMTPETGLKIGNSVSLMLNCRSEAEIRMYFDKLSDGGIVLHPLEMTFWGDIFGDLTDKFGNNWILNFNKKNS
jgi:PhnB protein